MFKNKSWYPFTLGIIYIAVSVGSALGNVGEIPVCSDNPYGWFIPLMVFVGLTLPFVLGFVSGRLDCKESNIS